MIKIIHIIPSLDVGGAEMMLYKLIKHCDKSKYQHEVISLRNAVALRSKFEALDVHIHILNMKRGIPSVKVINQATQICKDADIIQTWMYHANLIGYFVNRRAKKKLIWGIRQSHLVKGKNKWHTVVANTLCARLSKSDVVNKIISCTEIGAKNHIEYGYDSNKMLTISNGFETNNYYRNKEVIRSKYELPEDKIILITAGRWNYIKDYNNLLQAVSIAKAKQPNIFAVLCGREVTKDNQELMGIIKNCGLESDIKLMGERKDLVDLFSLSDIYISASQVEGFSNVIGEAMLCELPCVVTDVGDSALIVGEQGKLVAPKEANLLAKAIVELTQLSKDDRSVIGKKARERIVQQFEISNIVSKFEVVYEKLKNK